MRLVLHPDAVAEATAAGDWYDAQQPGLAADFASELERAFEIVLDNPGTWPLWPEIRGTSPTSLAVTPSSSSRSRTRGGDQDTGSAGCAHPAS